MLNKPGKSTMEANRLRTLSLEVFETLRNMNPKYMKKIFHKSTFSTRRPFNLQVKENHTTKYGNKNLKLPGPRIWNSLPNKIKKETDYAKLKEFIKGILMKI